MPGFLINNYSLLTKVVLEKKNYLFQVIEDDPETGCFFVGRGGFPNSKGVLECDAAVMVGDKCRFGAVAALQG